MYNYVYIKYMYIIYIYMYVCIFKYIYTYIHTYITLHYITLHYITIHYITLHYITLHTYILTLHYITLHYTTLHYITLHYITLHYIHTDIHTYITYIYTCIYIYIKLCIIFGIFPMFWVGLHSKSPPRADLPMLGRPHGDPSFFGHMHMLNFTWRFPMVSQVMGVLPNHPSHEWPWLCIKTHCDLGILHLKKPPRGEALKLKQLIACKQSNFV